MGLGTNFTVGFPEICYIIAVVGDGTAEQFERLRSKAIAHGPNEQRHVGPVPPTGEIISKPIER